MSASLNGSSHFNVAYTLVTAYPFSIFCRAQATNITAAHSAFTMCNGTADDDAHSLYFRGDTAGDPMQFRRTGPSAAGVGINSVASYSANTWVDMCGVAAAANDGRLYANNVKSTSATSIGFANGLVLIGANQALSTVSDRLNGLVASCAIWDVALTDDDVNSLFKGFSPRRIRPQSLKFYAPLVRNFQNLLSSTSLTQQGSPAVGAHHRSYGL